MTATMQEIRQALADAIQGAIPGLQASANVLNNPTPPAAHVMRGDIDYDLAMQGGLHDLHMRVQAFVALASDIGAQVLLDDYLSPDGANSMKAAIEADTSLGGLIQDLHVTKASGQQTYVREQGGPV